LSEVVEHLDLRTGRFHRLRLLIITRAAPQAPYRERFSPMTRGGRALTHIELLAAPHCQEQVRARSAIESAWIAAQSIKG